MVFRGTVGNIFFGWHLLSIGGWRCVFVVASPLQMRKCTNIFSCLIVVSPELHIMPVIQLFPVDAPTVLADALADVGGVGTPPPPLLPREHRSSH